MRVPAQEAEASVSRFHSLEIVDRRQETPDSVSLAFAVPDELREEFALSRPVPDAARDVRRRGMPAQLFDLVRLGRERTDRGEASGRRGLLALRQRRAAPGRAGRGRAARGALHRRYRRRSPSRVFRGRLGITPVLSIIRSALAANAQARATLVYGNKTTSSIMFRGALEELKDRYLGRLAVLHVLSRESQDIDILSGRVDREKSRSSRGRSFVQAKSTPTISAARSA